MDDAPRRLVVIAHRAANSLKTLRKAEDIGADLVEADVRLHHGRIEVRHLKTMRWLPLLWDRHPWRLAPGWMPRLVLQRLLERLRPETGVMLDLKGEDDGLPGAIMAALREAGAERRVVVCSQNWRLVDPLVAEPEVTAVHSIGRQSQLEAFYRRPETLPTQGVSIHAMLLQRAVCERLRERAPWIITWPINTPDTLAHVTACGVDGVTTDSWKILRQVVAQNAALTASTTS